MLYACHVYAYITGAYLLWHGPKTITAAWKTTVFALQSIYDLTVATPDCCDEACLCFAIKLTTPESFDTYLCPVGAFELDGLCIELQHSSLIPRVVMRHA